MAFTILIAGGGVGGLTLAHAVLRKAEEEGGCSVEVRVLEREATPASSGHGLTLYEGVGILHRLGLLDGLENDRIASSSVLARHVVTADGCDVVAAQQAEAHHHKCAPRSVRRPDLVQLLYQTLPNKDVVVKFGWEVVDIVEEDNKVKVTNQDDQTMVGDVLVGFDGVRSCVRRAFVDERNAEFGRCCVLLGTATLDKKDVKIESAGALVHRFDQTTGSVGVYASTGSTSVAWTIGYRCDEEPPRNTAWKNDPDTVKAAARDLLRQWPLSSSRDFEALLSHSDSCMRLGVYAAAAPKLKNPWSRGRLVTAGDAAHAVLPLLGEGANLAMCDAVVLARHLVAAANDYGNNATIQHAIERYEEERRPPSESAIRLMWWLRPVMLSQNGMVCRVRNSLLHHMLQQDGLNVHKRGVNATSLLDRPMKNHNPHASVGSSIGYLLAHAVVLGGMVLAIYHARIIV